MSTARRTLLVLAAALIGVAPALAGEGSLKGTVKLKVPEGWTVPVTKIDKDTASCCRDSKVPAEKSPCAGKNELPDDSIIVDVKTGALANAVVWFSTPPEGGTRDWAFLQKVKDHEVNLLAKQVTFDQKFCRFKPHILLIPKGWDVQLASQDDVAHNVHTFPFANDATNVVVPAAKLDANGAAARVVFGPVQRQAMAERTPFKVQCDIHPWMVGAWVIMDHPYYAVTDEKGEFSIDKIPAGKYQVKVWHLKLGSKLSGAKGVTVEIKDGAVTELTGLNEVEAPK